MIPPVEAAAVIAAKGTPVVYVDTCSILDLIRGQRDVFNSDQAGAAVYLVGLAEEGRLTLALPEQVITEFTSNAVEVRLGGERSINDVSRKVAHIFATMQAYGLAIPALPQISGVEYVTAADAVINRLLTAAVLFSRTAEATEKAMQRVVDGRAPATSAKQSAKDCLVVESVFEVLSLARAAGFVAPAYFLSANVTEYGDVTKRVLHPDLTSEFEALSMAFAKNYLELRFDQTIATL
jgi:hypothetical protein